MKWKHDTTVGSNTRSALFIYVCLFFFFHVWNEIVSILWNSVVFLSVHELPKLGNEESCWQWCVTWMLCCLCWDSKHPKYKKRWVSFLNYMCFIIKHRYQSLGLKMSVCGYMAFLRDNSMLEQNSWQKNLFMLCHCLLFSMGSRPA